MEKLLAEKPTTVVEYVDRLVEVPGPERIVEVEKEIIKEVPVERIVETVVEKIIEVEKPVEVIREVPGPERIVQVEKVVEDTARINQLAEDNRILKKRIKELEELANKPAEVIERIVEVEKTVEVPIEVEKAATGDLREAARLLAHSEFNKEDLTTDQIYEMLQKSSADEVKRKLGFWAVPLPKQDKDISNTNKQYIGKR